MRVKKIDLNKVLITGAEGMIGSYIDFGIRTDHDSLDITDDHEVSRVINKLRPEAIIHLAAATDLERCKNDPRYAYWVNAIGTYNIATAALEVVAGRRRGVYHVAAGLYRRPRPARHRAEQLGHVSGADFGRAV